MTILPPDPSQPHLHQTILELSADWIWEIDLQGRHIYSNPAVQEILGYTTDEMAGRSAFELIHEEDRVVIEKELPHFVSQKMGWRGLILRWKHKNGHLRHLESNANPKFDASGQLVGFVGLDRDITERVQLLAQLQSKTDQLQHLSDNLADGMVYQITGSLKGKRNFTYLSPAMERLHGLKVEAVLADASLFYEQILQEDRPIVAEKEAIALEHQSKLDLECRVQLPSGQICWRHFIAAPRTLSGGETVWDGIEMDVTEKHKLQEAHRNHHMLDSLGVLAGGIAHDFNNLMCGLFGYIEIARVLSKDPALTPYLDEAIGVIHRTRGLTDQLLTFSKGGCPVKSVQPLFPFVKESANFALSGSNVCASFEIDPDLWPCEIDKQQFAQVIDNLVINAKQAMPNGGKLEIRASNITLDHQSELSLSTGPYVKLDIKDHGKGISKENISKIFDPYFTTKPKGHGLGLATSYSIINRHDGLITVESQQDVGTIFSIYLPATPSEIPSSATEPTTVHLGKGTIILADDEKAILDVCENLLKDFGYDVLCTQDGQGAIALLKKSLQTQHPISAMILDLTIPGGTGGKEALPQIRNLDPDLPVFVASGYADDAALANPLTFGFTDSIRKPFTRAELASVLEKHLGKDK